MHDDQCDRDRTQSVERGAVAEDGQRLSAATPRHAGRSAIIPRVIAVRVALLGLAVAAAAWFALGVRAAHDQDAVSALVNSHTSLTAAQANAAEVKIGDAQTLNPDESLLALHAQIEFNAGHAATAERLAKTLVRRAPRDVDSWVTLAVLTRRGDPAANALAIAKVHQLAPPVSSTP